MKKVILSAFQMGMYVLIASVIGDVFPVDSYSFWTVLLSVAALQISTAFD